MLHQKQGSISPESAQSAMGESLWKEPLLFQWIYKNTHPQKYKATWNIWGFLVIPSLMVLSPFLLCFDCLTWYVANWFANLLPLWYTSSLPCSQFSLFFRLSLIGMWSFFFCHYRNLVPFCNSGAGICIFLLEAICLMHLPSSFFSCKDMWLIWKLLSFDVYVLDLVLGKYRIILFQVPTELMGYIYTFTVTGI